ncbi:MAG: DUF6263 family protein [Planctomycetota bacterium]
MSLPLRVLMLLSTLVLFGGAPKVVAQEIQPRYRFEVGQVLRYRLSEEQTIRNSLMPGEQSQKMDRVYRFTVLAWDADARTATLEVRTESMRIETTGGPVKEVYDSSSSNNDARSPTTKMNDAMLEQKIRITLSDRGDIIAFRGIDVESILQEAFGDAASNQFFQMQLEEIRQSLSDENMRTVFQRMFIQLPATELSPKDEWQQSIEMTLPVFGPMKVDTNYTYVGVERKDGARQAQIRFDRSFERGQPGKISPGGIELSIENLTCTGNGLVSFAVDEGRIQRMTLMRTETGTLKPAVEQPGGMGAATVEAKTRSTLELLGDG